MPNNTTPYFQYKNFVNWSFPTSPPPPKKKQIYTSEFALKEINLTWQAMRRKICKMKKKQRLNALELEETKKLNLESSHSLQFDSRNFRWLKKLKRVAEAEEKEKKKEKKIGGVEILWVKFSFSQESYQIPKQIIRSFGYAKSPVLAKLKIVRWPKGKRSIENLSCEILRDFRNYLFTLHFPHN